MITANSAHSYEKLPTGRWGLVMRPRCEWVGENDYVTSPGRCCLAATRQAFCGTHHRMLSVREIRLANPSLSHREALKLYSPTYKLKV